jgi:hypothetical protein
MPANGPASVQIPDLTGTGSITDVGRSPPHHTRIDNECVIGDPASEPWETLQPIIDQGSEDRFRWWWGLIGTIVYEPRGIGTSNLGAD